MGPRYLNPKNLLKGSLRTLGPPASNLTVDLNPRDAPLMSGILDKRNLERDCEFSCPLTEMQHHLSLLFIRSVDTWISDVIYHDRGRWLHHPFMLAWAVWFELPVKFTWTGYRFGFWRIGCM